MARAIYCGAEDLPFGDQGAVAFIISPETKSACVVTKYDEPEKNLTEQSFQVKLQSDTSAEINETSVIKGQWTPMFRQRFQEGTKQKMLYEETYNRYFKGTTTEQLVFSDLSNYNQPVEIKARLKVPQFGRTEGGRYLFKPCLFPQSFFGYPLSMLVAAQTRHYDFVFFFPYRVSSKAIYQIPPGYVIKAIPENVSEENEFARYQLTYKKTKPDEIEVETSFELKVVRIPKEGYDKFRTFCVTVHQAEEEEIGLEKK